MTNLSPLGQAALDYAELGWPIFPCIPHGKAPLGAAVPNGLKNATTDPRRLTYWWRRWPNANIAVACGHPGPDVIDIDTKDGRHGFRHYWTAHNGGHLHNPVAVVRTPSGGLHLWFDGTQQRGGAIGRDKALELKAVGGYVLLPPSRVVCPDYGYDGIYHVIEHRDQPATVDFPAIKALIDPLPAAPSRTIRYLLNPGELRPGDDYNQRGEDWYDLLTRHGWTYLGHHGAKGLWRRPAKTTGLSATTNALGTDRFHVFSSSTVFDPGSHSKFWTYTVLEHGGRVGAATAALREAGYGTPRKQVAA